jgi:hypothetical protein
VRERGVGGGADIDGARPGTAENVEAAELEAGLADLGLRAAPSAAAPPGPR